MEIRGWGNSTWTTPSPYDPNPKNPYKLKFKKKQSPFGLTKGKKWVLLANSKVGSLLTNAIAMKVAQVAGAEAANHIIPVDLYINGDYRGNYNFTEQVGVSANSIKLDNEDKATLVELDTYYDEPYKFKDPTYGLPANIKFPDFDEDAPAITMADIESRFGQITSAVVDGGKLSDILDLDALARYMLVNQLVCNQEILHPKSTYLYNADVTDPASKWKFGPVWDFDWAYGYDVDHNFATVDSGYDYWHPTKTFESTKFWNTLLESEEVKRAYYKVWMEFMNGGLQQVLDYCDSYYQWTAASLSNNQEKWNDRTDYAKQSSRIRQWLKDRAEAIYNSLEKFDDVTGIRSPDKGNALAVDVVDLSGRVVKRHANMKHWSDGLQAGVYIAGGKRVTVK